MKYADFIVFLLNINEETNIDELSYKRGRVIGYQTVGGVRFKKRAKPTQHVDVQKSNKMKRISRRSDVRRKRSIALKKFYRTAKGKRLAKARAKLRKESLSLSSIEYDWIPIKNINDIHDGNIIKKKGSSIKWEIMGEPKEDSIVLMTISPPIKSAIRNIDQLVKNKWMKRVPKRR